METAKREATEKLPADHWAYKAILPLKRQPAALVLTRQNLPTLDRTKYAPASGVHKGGYVLADTDGRPEVILIATTVGGLVPVLLDRMRVDPAMIVNRLSGEGPETSLADD